LSSALAHSDSGSGFGRFQLDTALDDALRASGFHEPRPIQAETITACLAGRDVLGLSQTGTGKTAAFVLPILHRIVTEGISGPRALILAPTRELARQIDQDLRSLGRYTDVETATVYGGVAMGGQIRALRRHPDVVVGCPGRVLDLLQQGVLDLSAVDMLVLDEADHMFDMGFFRDVRKILAVLPKRRQNLLFSATMPREVRSLADQVLRDPCVVELAPSRPSEAIEHFLYSVDESRKRGLLDHVLSSDDCKSAIVFMRTKHRAKRTAQQLERRGLRAVALQGNMSQAQRDRAMAGFREGRFDVLVATDVAARGLDVAGVSYVVNFDVPASPDAYTHRIGRTGRSGASGKACTFVTSADRGWVRATERALGARIPQREAPVNLPSEAVGGGAPRPPAGRRGRPRRSGRPGQGGGRARARRA
jgi:ATP-dependent RNA helicase RhlE